MGDDLSAFFAKKAQKSKEKKKKGAIKIDDVGNRLERKVRKQEQEDPEESMREELELADDRFLRSQENEDSECHKLYFFQSLAFYMAGVLWCYMTNNGILMWEQKWLDFTDTKNRLADVRVRDMDYTDTIEEETTDKKASAEHVKTWNFEFKEDKDDNDENLIKKQPACQNQPDVYRPPTMRTAQKLDINNDEMFPSLANADKIAKELDEKKKQEEKERKKNPAAFQKEENFQDAPTQRQYIQRGEQDRDRQRYQPPSVRNNIFTEARPKREPPPPTPSRADEADSWRSNIVQKSVESPKESAREEVRFAAPKADVYIAPNLRNLQN